MKLLFILIVTVLVIAVTIREQKLLALRKIYIDIHPSLIGFQLPGSLWRQVCKRLFDIIFSAAVLLTIFPLLFFILTPLIKIASSGPVFFVQYRLGIFGKPFKCYKFRSMRQNPGTAPVSVNDPRIPPIGKFIRRTHLDEFPQFFNVLIGDMSLVGPRPLQAKIYREFSNYEKGLLRLTIRPGLTGLAQMNVARNLNPDKTIKNDLYYIRKLSLRMDLKLIFQTLRLTDHSY